jgi:hypothetical protein
VRAACEADGKHSICEQVRLRFFRSVDVVGHRSRSGVVCRADEVTPNLRYYTYDMFDGNAGCASVSYDYETKRPTVELSK